MPEKIVNLGKLSVGGGQPLVFIAGPCVIESRSACIELAERLAELAAELSVGLIFKASFDKANRTSIDSFRGPGLEAGLEILAEIKTRCRIPLLTDIHTEAQAAPVAAIVDVIQIPAFLCRQTDLLLAAAETGRCVNVKKGQFLAPGDMRHVIEKIEHAGNHEILLTERGVSFGYNNLVADLRGLLIMRSTGYPVVFDATHSVQRPGAGEGASAGDGIWAPALARAAVATGACDAVFMETHLNPGKALSDKANLIPFDQLESLWATLVRIHEIQRHME